MGSSLEYKRVLVIDGGGFRGLGPLLIIDRIVRESSIRARKQLKPCDIFDLICGTSVGGLLAVLLGRLRLDCGTAILIYRRLTEGFCGLKGTAFYQNLLTQEFQDSAGFDAILKEIVSKYGGSSDPPLRDQDLSSRTMTFVTTTAGKPDYSNRIHPIRSYAVSKGALPPPPVNHVWSIYEAVKATMASPLYMEPITLESIYEFSDSSFSSFMNPLDIARKECSRLWPASTPFLIVSVGTALGGLCQDPTDISGKWIATSRHVEQFGNKLLEKAPGLPSTTKTKDRANAIARQLVIASSRAQLAHQLMVEGQAADSLSLYYRLDPPLPRLSPVDLCDCFGQDVETSIKAWMEEEGDRLVKRIVEDAVPWSSEPITVEEARKLEPPKPKSDSVNPGYNPVLDQKRPEKLIDYLRDYHVLFVVDDSTSMERENRWTSTREALKGIADYAFEYNSDEVDLLFLHGTEVWRGVKKATRIQEIFDSVKREKGTPTGTVLRRVLDEQITKLDKAVNSPGVYSKIRPLDIIFLTDGRPDPDEKDAPENVLAEAVKRMKFVKHHPNCIGVQFVQIGNDSKAGDALMKLVHGDNGSIVDTVPYNPDVPMTSEQLQRILLGGLHPNVRALTQYKAGGEQAKTGIRKFFSSS